MHEQNSGAWAVLRRFMYLGLGVKRWMLLWSIGVSIIAMGLAFVIKNLFDLNLPDVLPGYLEGVIVSAVGLAAAVGSIYGLYRSVGPLLLSTQNINSLTETLYTRRSRARGPRIVTIGGGTGMSVLLRGLKAHTDNITAIVTVADDGGSSGRLRQELGVLPPGDFRSCLVALSDDETLVRDLFQYRFDQGMGLAGHSFGNLFIVAMTDIAGSFERALSESSRVLAVHGQIVPATIANLRLSARLSDGSIVEGESNIGEYGGEIEELMIRPQNAVALPQAIQAILEADMIVIGPGSLYTSILPNLLVSDVSKVLQASKAQKLYVCNVATQKGETSGYTIVDHVSTLQRHTYLEIVDYIIANNVTIEPGPPFLGHPVLDDGRSIAHAQLVMDDLIDPAFAVRHDPAKLAQCIIDVYHGNYPAPSQDVALSVGQTS